MITAYPFASLGSADHGWLKARHHFSFASYYNPQRMGFGVLRVINDDIIQAGTGFGKHPHQNMEIITYVRRGAITHKDSMDNSGHTEAGDVQVMSAGTGVQHSEYNLEATDTSLYQIWIEPALHNVPPRWESRKFPQESVTGQLIPLASGRPADLARGALMIHQDATLWGGRLKGGTQLTHALVYNAYLLISEGKVEIDGALLTKGDGAAITDCSEVIIQALVDSEILIIDVPES
jgi:redox-sensitive bicupin YhaK (pirin superfamily)